MGNSISNSILVFCLLIQLIYSQKIALIDAETQEFIEEVSYSLMLKEKEIASGKTQIVGATELPQLDYDFLLLKHSYFEDKKIKKSEITDIVLMQPRPIILDEVFVGSSAKKYQVLGERNKLVNEYPLPLAKSLGWLNLIKNRTDNSMSLDKVGIRFDQVKHETQFKIQFYKVSEQMPNQGHQFLNEPELIFTSEILTIMPKNKKEFESDITTSMILKPGESIGISIVLVDYLKDGKSIQPKEKEMTKIAKQYSNFNDYYGLIQVQGKLEPEPNMMNFNFAIRYDFAYHFFKKPSKQILNAPAVVVYALPE